LACNLYSASSSNVDGRTVAIADAHDDPNAESDLASCRSYFNGWFRRSTSAEEQNSPNAHSGLAQEISLDLDMVTATYHNCSILLVRRRRTAMSIGHSSRLRGQGA
jgi:hypothetical protein